MNYFIDHGEEDDPTYIVNPNDEDQYVKLSSMIPLHVRQTLSIIIQNHLNQSE